VAVTIQNIRISQEEVIDFGYCDNDMYCAGFRLGGTCIGSEQIDTTCYEREGPEHYRRVEAECGVLAYNLCGDDTSGTAWASGPNATYRGQNCSEWAAQDERIDLLSCDETYSGSTDWQHINGE
jgi:hypothetical protein